MTDSVNTASVGSQGILLMLASSNLPIGSYTYSQGIESAIDQGLVKDEATTLSWMQDYLALTLEGVELPLIAAIMALLDKGLSQSAAALGQYYLASRESHEFEFEATQMAHAFEAWIGEVLALDVPKNLTEQGFLPLLVSVCHYQGLSAADSMMAYGFGQLENMVLAAVKTVPLGQMAGQRVLWQLQQSLAQSLPTIKQRVAKVIEEWQAKALSDTANNIAAINTNVNANINANTEENITELIGRLTQSASLPNLAILSCQHEQQYSRLFRS